MKRKIVLALLATMLCCVPVHAEKETDWKTAISVEEDLELLFAAEYEEPKILYTTVNLNKRLAPNIDSDVAEVLQPVTEVIAIADYHGWTRIVEISDIGCSYFYVWNEYLSDEKPTKDYLGTFKLTAYCNCSSCCGKWAGGATASGKMPTVGRTVAMGGIPFGTKLLINGHTYTVEDRGTPYGHVDIYFGSHGEACNFGLQYADVYVVK